MELRGDRGHNTARLLEQFRCIMERNLNLTFSDEKINEFGPGIGDLRFYFFTHSKILSLGGGGSDDVLIIITNSYYRHDVFLPCMHTPPSVGYQQLISKADWQSTQRKYTFIVISSVLCHHQYQASTTPSTKVSTLRTSR